MDTLQVRYDRVDRALYSLAHAVAQTKSSKEVLALLHKRIVEVSVDSPEYEAACYACTTLAGIIKMSEVKPVKAKKKLPSPPLGGTGPG